MSRRRGAFSAFEKTASQAVDPSDSLLFRLMFVIRTLRSIIIRWVVRFEVAVMG